MRYLRAVAKVGFHYFLHTSTACRGDEPEFAPVRNFIRHGVGESKTFVNWPSPQCVPEFADGLVPSQWTHVFISDANRAQVTARAQFFVGPENLPSPSLIYLGNTPNSIADRTITSHWVVYYDSKTDDYDAEINEVEVLGVADRTTTDNL